MLCQRLAVVKPFSVQHCTLLPCCGVINTLLGYMFLCLFFLRRLRSFNGCSDMMCMFYHTITESALFYAVVCWGSCATDRNCSRLDKLVKKASSVVGRRLDPLSAVVEQRMRRKLYSVLGNNEHPLHSILAGQRSSCRTERFRRSFVPTATRLFNSDC